MAGNERGTAAGGVIICNTDFSVIKPWSEKTMNQKQNHDLPVYRLLTGPDDATFCHRVSEMLNNGYQLYGSPSVTYDPQKKTVIAAQAVIRVADTKAFIKLPE